MMLALSVSVTKRQKLRKIKRLIQTIENVSHAVCRCRTNKSPREGAFVRWRGRRDDRSADLVVVQQPAKFTKTLISLEFARCASVFYPHLYPHDGSPALRVAPQQLSLS